MIRVINVYEEDPFIYTLGAKVNEELIDLESRGWNILKLDYYESRKADKKISGYFITVELTDEAYIKTKSIDELVEEVLDNKWGDEEERKRRLGNKYKAVQDKVDEILEQRNSTNEPIIVGFETFDKLMKYIEKNTKMAKKEFLEKIIYFVEEVSKYYIYHDETFTQINEINIADYMKVIMNFDMGV